MGSARTHWLTSKQTRMSKSPWFLSRPAGHRRLRLFCFPYAGGNAAHYLPWQDRLDPSIEVVGVQLPGRGARLRETPLDSLHALVAQLAVQIPLLDPVPFAFFGHSLGALIAFELARYCKLHLMRMPLMLFVSGCDAPQVRTRDRRLHELDDEALIAALGEFNGTPPELLEHRELMDLLAPTIRADFAMAANYRYRPGLLLDTPIVVLRGHEDTEIAGHLDGPDAWQRETTAACRVQWFDGDHFFINSSRDAVIALLDADLKARLPIAARLPSLHSPGLQP